ncbi:dTMP kinase [Candidatus Aerophobetes bacterium]|uniref:Thymidylate kinase n=1 Tax=Aerophobetes bacterium TaxID=2030807 RepID=A0A2A4YNM8_UNCAE|nr:MAG: dTMP kinase [Candidatus Aerophobetes bacterium]
MKRKTRNTGLFLTLEGGEGSGKTTLSQKLYDYLIGKGSPVLLTRAPGGTELGKSIREILLHKESIKLNEFSELLLFLADRAQHVHEVIMPALKNGQIVLCDRFNDSTIAYQGAARDSFSPAYVEELCLFATENLVPDLTFYLDLDPKLGLKRANEAILKDGKNSYDRLEKEELFFHEKVREGYLNLARKHSSRIVTINAETTQEKVFQEVINITDKKLLEVSCT